MRPVDERFAVPSPCSCLGLVEVAVRDVDHVPAKHFTQNQQALVQTFGQDDLRERDPGGLFVSLINDVGLHSTTSKSFRVCRNLPSTKTIQTLGGARRLADGARCPPPPSLPLLSWGSWKFGFLSWELDDEWLTQKSF